MNCPHCGEEFVPLEGQHYCSFCGRELAQDRTDQGGPTTESSARSWTESDSLSVSTEPVERYSPWEDHDNLGFMDALIQTVKQGLLEPRKFFARMPVEGGFLNPLLFGLIVTVFGNMTGYFWSLVFPNPLLPKSGTSGPTIAAVGVLIPCLSVIGLFVGSLLTHACLFLVGGATRNFEATFRTICYASGPEVVNAVPVVGWVVAAIWKVVNTIIGLSEAHGISTVRSAAAVFLPLILCCGVSIGAIILGALGAGGTGN